MFRMCGFCAGPLVVVALLASSALAVTPLQGVFRHAKLADAWRASRASKRPILVFVTMDGCHYCDKMQGVTFSTPGVSNLLRNNFEAVVVDQSLDAELVKQLNVQRFPTTILALPNGTIVERMEGFVEPGRLQKRLVDRDLHSYR